MPPPDTEPLLPEMVPMLRDKDKKTVYVPRGQEIDYALNGYSYIDEEAPSAEEVDKPWQDDVADALSPVLPWAERVAAGPTLGLSGPLADLTTGAVGAMTGYQGPRAAGRGLDAPLDEESALMREMKVAQQARQERREETGLAGDVLEIASSLPFTGGAKAGASLLSKLATMAPAELAARVGARQAAKILGSKAGSVIAARALGTAAESAIGGAVGSTSEHIPQLIENPLEAIKDIGIDTGASTLIGTGLGAGVGTVETIARRISQKAGKVAGQAYAAQHAPANLRASEGVEAMLNRAEVPAAMVPEPKKTLAQKMSSMLDASGGGAQDRAHALERAVADDMEYIARERAGLDADLGINAKRAYNKEAVGRDLLGELTDHVDPDDVAAGTVARQIADTAQSRFDDIAAKLGEAQKAGTVTEEARLAAQAALDLPEKFKPTTGARKLMREMKVNDLGDAEVAPAIERVRGRLAQVDPASPEAAQLQEIERFLTPKPSQAVMLERKAAFDEARVAAKQAQNKIGLLERQRDLAQRNLEEASGALAKVPKPRRMSNVEYESRGMFSGLIETVQNQIPHVAAKDQDAMKQLLAQLTKHRDAMVEAYKRGDIETAMNLIDQGTKHALRDFANSSRSTVVSELAKTLHDIPRSFMERADVFGADIAGRQIEVNRRWSPAILRQSDADAQTFWKRGGELSASGWGPEDKPNAETISALIENIGTPKGDAKELAFKRAEAASLDDLAMRAKAWGGGNTEYAGRVKKLAERQQRVFDNLEKAADLKRSVQAGQALRATGDMTAGGFALYGAITGQQNIAIPAIAGRWMIGAIARSRGSYFSKLGKFSTRLVSPAWKVSKEVARKGAQVDAHSDAAQRQLERSRALAEGGPEALDLAEHAQSLNEAVPGMGDAMLAHEYEKAQYIQEAVPKPPSAAVWGPIPKASLAQAAELERRLVAVSDPPATFERIMTGRGSKTDMQSMQRIFPKQYQQMVAAIMDKVGQNPARVTDPEQRMYISRVTGQPLTPALQNIQEAQKRAAASTASAESTGQPQGQGQNGADGVTPRAALKLDPNEVYGSRADNIMA